MAKSVIAAGLALALLGTVSAFAGGATAVVAVPARAGAVVGRPRLCWP